MAEFDIRRFCLDPKFTLGALRLEGAPTFFTLEDAVREVVGQPVASWKLPGITAIPVGRYELVMDMSTRFKRMMPHLLDVPGFTGIRMHGFGVQASVVNTEGCPLLGYGANIMSGTVQQSLAAAQAYYERLDEFLKLGRVWISVKNP